ncbi:MAG: hypothetical protein H7A33_04635 [Deltaproteobacteria bacterium]|nr:hypothetical protein [Deltaproteobacteria bacterium]
MKFTRFIHTGLIVSFFTLLSVSAGAIPNESREEILLSGPRFHDVLDAALKSDGLSASEMISWKKKIKAAAFLPTLYAGYDHSLKRGVGSGTSENVSISSGVVSIGPQESDYDYDADLGQVVRVRAVWRLDETIFNRDLFSWSREMRSHLQLKHQVSERLFKVYRARQQLLERFLRFSNLKSRPAQKIYEEYLLLTEYLDALTGGRLSDRWYLVAKNVEEE